MRSNNGESKTMVWTGQILMVLAVLFLLMDGVMKLFKPAFVVAATLQLGYPESTIVGIGTALVACTIVYIVPQTSLLGAILLTGYLGGAVASNVRAETGLFNTAFPVMVAAVVWGALLLRDQRLRSVLLAAGRGAESAGNAPANLVPNN